jgi:hypothetical protein
VCPVATGFPRAWRAAERDELPACLCRRFCCPAGANSVVHAIASKQLQSKCCICGGHQARGPYGKFELASEDARSLDLFSHHMQGFGRAPNGIVRSFSILARHRYTRVTGV